MTNAPGCNGSVDFMEKIKKVIVDYSADSGERPSILVELDGRNFRCHDSVLRLKSPKFLMFLSKELYFINMDEDEFSDNVKNVVYFLYTGKLEHFEESKNRYLNLLVLALGLDLPDLAKLAVRAKKRLNNDGLAYAAGNVENNLFALSTEIDGRFDQDKFPIDQKLKRPQDFFVSDLFDFQGKSINSKISPRDLGMVEEELNFLEFDEKTYKLLKDHESKETGLIKVDFELDILDKRRGSVVSRPLVASAKGGALTWRIQIVFPESTETSKVGVYLQVDGGGAEWSCNAAGNLIVVNQLDRIKDIVRSFTIDTTLGIETSSTGWADMLKLEDVQDRSKGFGKDGKIIFKSRVLLLGKSACYVEMMERRIRKQKKDNGSQSQQREEVKKHPNKRTNAPSKTKNTCPAEMKLCDGDQLFYLSSFSLDNGVENKVNGIKKAESQNKVQTKKGKNKENIKKCESGNVKDDKVAIEILLELVSEVILQSEMKKERVARKLKRAISKKVHPVEKCHVPSCTEVARHRCSRCLGVRFCSKECMDRYWIVHREECDTVRERKQSDWEHGLD